MAVFTAQAWWAGSERERLVPTTLASSSGHADGPRAGMSAPRVDVAVYSVVIITAVLESPHHEGAALISRTDPCKCRSFLSLFKKNCFTINDTSLS